MLSLLAGYTNTCKPLSRCAIYSKLSTIPDLWKPSGDDIRGNGHVQAYHIDPNSYPQKSTFCGYFLDFTAYIAGELVDRANVQGKVPQGYQHWQSSNPPKDQSYVAPRIRPLVLHQQEWQQGVHVRRLLRLQKKEQVPRTGTSSNWHSPSQKLARSAFFHLAKGGQTSETECRMTCVTSRSAVNSPRGSQVSHGLALAQPLFGSHQQESWEEEDLEIPEEEGEASAPPVSEEQGREEAWEEEDLETPEEEGEASGHPVRGHKG